MDVNPKRDNEYIYWPGTNQILKPAKEVARILGVHYNTVSRWIKSGAIECIRVGKSIHFTYSQISDFLEKNKHQTKIKIPIGKGV